MVCSCCSSQRRPRSSSRSMSARPRSRSRSPTLPGIGCWDRSEFAMTATALAATVAQRVRPVAAGPGSGEGGRSRPPGTITCPVPRPRHGRLAWQVLELNPAHVTEQRRVAGPASGQDRRDRSGGDHRAVAGRAWRSRSPTGTRCSGSWSPGRRTAIGGSRPARRRRISCSGQLDRAFPGLTLALPDVLGTKVGPAGRRRVRRPGPAGRVRRRPGSSGSPRPAGCSVRRPVAERSGRRRPRRFADRGRRGGPAGAGRRPDVAGRSRRRRSMPPRPSWRGCCRVSPFRHA